jgi:hypothetical protein
VSDANDTTDVADNRLWARPREYEEAALRWMNQAMRDLSKSLHPLLAQLGEAEVREGPGPLPSSPTTTTPVEASPLYRPIGISHEWVVSADAVVNFDTDTFLSDLDAMADAFGGQMIRGMFEHIGKLLEGTENSIDGSGRDFFDVIIQSLETIDMSFDDEGRPRLTIVMHPDQADKLRGRAPTPEQEATINEVLDRRREEWLAARRRRELPGHPD